MQKRNVVKIVTPAGRAVFPKLDKPDTKFDAAGVYSVKLAVPAESVADILSKLEALRDEFLAEQTAKLVESGKAGKAKSLKTRDIAPVEFDSEGNETGNVLLSFKMKATGQRKDGSTFTRAPSVFDSKRVKLDPVPPIWGGSTLKVAGEAMAYYMASTNEVGVTLYLQGVQIIELKTGGGSSAQDFGFGEEAGFTADTAPKGEMFSDEGAESPDDF